jgi:1-acyl-sn-glycerol-3-phosphate acyltransferase
MLVILVVICVFALFFRYDLQLRAARFIYRGKAVQLVDRYCARVVDRIFALLKTYCGFGLEFENRSGGELPERFMLIANHQSLLDIPVCIKTVASRRLRFVAKKELGGGVPFVSSVLRTQGHALVKRRGDSAQTMSTLHRFARRCRRDGTCPVVFPEGTRSRDGSMGTFYTAGVRKVQDEEPLPMVVAAIDGGWRVATFKDFVRNARGSRYRFRLAAVLPAPRGKKETLEAIAKARSIIDAELSDMRKLPASG